MKKSLFLICIVCLFCSSCLFQGEITTIVEGSVVDDSTNLPVEGAHVVFSFTKDAGFPPKSKPVYNERVFTNNEGRYTMSQTSKRGEVDDILVGVGHDSIRYIIAESSGSVDIGERGELNFRLLKR